MQRLTRDQVTKSSQSVRSARKRTGHVFEKIHPRASGSNLINYERLGKTPRMLLAMARMKYLPFRNKELQT
jgi:hypothetical protein